MLYKERKKALHVYSKTDFLKAILKPKSYPHCSLEMQWAVWYLRGKMLTINLQWPCKSHSNIVMDYLRQLHDFIILFSHYFKD